MSATVDKIEDSISNQLGSLPEAQPHLGPLPEPVSKPSRKRRRTVISCTECHRRKQKCDRNLPCSNCISRGKTSVCNYESEATIIKRHSHQNGSAIPTSSEEGSPGDFGRYTDDDAAKFASDSAAQQLSALGYAKSNGLNALGFVEKIQSHGRDGRIMQVESVVKPDNALREKYKGLVRQLPSRQYVEQLVETFFREVNWHYFSLERHAFDQQLQGWLNLSFSVLNRGPQELPPELRFFPGLLFQVLAQALQFSNPGQDSELDSLKYVKEMTLDDLASDYSESGADIIKILGKRECTLVTVQAGFLRTSFLKNSGNIPEAWHSLSATIRDAQEIELHKILVTFNHHGTSEKTFEDLWHMEDRRRMWMILSSWDPHMAMTLGRPTTLDCRYDNIIYPVDTSPSFDRRTSTPVPRAENEPPTPLTMALVNAKAVRILSEILALEQDGPCPRDYTKVERLHEQILQGYRSVPAYFRSDYPDTSFDSRPECYWLPESRPLFDTFLGFSLMCLHRPYVFTIGKSRLEALKAGLSILRAQRNFFQYLQAKHYKMFNLVLSTFDAIVLVAAVYILYPQENQEHLHDSLQHFEWAMERFDTMSERNAMAKAALGVLQAIHVRLMRVVGRRGMKRGPPSPLYTASSSSSEQQRAASATSNSHSGSNPSRGSSISGHSNGSSGTLSHAPPPSCTDHSNIQPELRALGVPPTTVPEQMSSYQAATTSWPPQYSNPLIPGYEANNYDFGNMAPLQPLHDLLFNDLVGMPDVSAATAANNTSTFYDTGIPWQFEGEFKDDSFWNLMNQYNNP